MKMAEAQKIINGGSFMVSFHWKEGGMLRGDYFPGKGEKLIETEEEAWVLATKFAKKMVGRVVDIYVIGSDFSPVPGYKTKYIENRNW